MKLPMSEAVTNPRVGFVAPPSDATKSHNSSSPSHRSPSETGVTRLGNRVCHVHDELGLRVKDDAVAVQREDLADGVGTGLEANRGVGRYRRRTNALSGQMEPDPLDGIDLFNAEGLVRRLVAIRDDEVRWRRRRLCREAAR